VKSSHAQSGNGKPSHSQAAKWRWLWLGLGLVGVAGLSASAGALLAVAIAGTPLMQTQLSLEDKSAFNQGEIATGMNLKFPQLTRPVNILVLGVKVLSSDVNNPPPETQGLGYHATINSLDGLSDSMMLLRFNPQTQQLVVLSLPRDTRTYVDGVGMTKLNEANAIGGPASAARSTSELLGGVGIDRYVRINVLGVEKLIDALGGVTVYVPQDMRYQDDSQHLYINLKKGEHHLNGTQAVQFLRFRYDAYGDIGRVQRQQMFLRALRDQTLKPSTLARLPQILSVIQSNLDTNLSVEELIALAGFASQNGRANMQMLMLPGSFSGGEYSASYWLPKQAQIADLVQQYFGVVAANFASAEVQGEHVTIAVQDSAAETATVEQLISHLGSAGYGDIFVDEPWTEPLGVTQIIAQQGDTNQAQLIRQLLGFGEVLVESTGSLQSDITIRLGQDAKTALAKPPKLDAGTLVPTSANPMPVIPANSELPNRLDQTEPDLEGAAPVDPALESIDPLMDPGMEPAFDPVGNPE
jgi:LCP family protein required for cell wall assembly